MQVDLRAGKPLPGENTFHKLTTMIARRQDLIATAVCALFGFFLSTLPHFIAWRQLGHPWYFADPDGSSVYLHFVAHAYYFHPLTLADPARAFSGAAFYPWIAFIPFVLISKLFSAGPASVFFLWSAWGGVGLGAVFYAILRTFVARPFLAVVATLILLADTGLILGRPFDRQVAQVIETLHGGSGAYPGAWSYCLQQFRTVNPAVSWPFLGLFLWAMLKLNEKVTRRREVVGAVSFGLLFYVYFYYWTAAGLTLAIAFVVQSSLRGPYFRVGALGTLIGLPWLFYQYTVRHSQPSQWLERYAYFVRIGRFDELQISKIAILWLAVAIVMLWKMRERRATFLCFFVIASMALSNHQIVTRLGIQNYHWQHAWGAGVCLLVVATIAMYWDRAARIPKPILLAAGVFACAHIAGGIYLRAWEATKAEAPMKIQRDLADYLRQRQTAPCAFLSGRIMAGDPDFVDFAVGFDRQVALVGIGGLGPSVSDDEWRERRTLDAWLRGATLQNIADQVNGYYGSWYQLTRTTPREKADERRLVENLFSQIQARPQTWFSKYLVHYVALPSGQSPPNQNQTWRQVCRGERWTVWEIAPR